MKFEMKLIHKLDYALTLLIGIENVDLIYEAKSDKEIEKIILEIWSSNGK